MHAGADLDKGPVSTSVAYVLFTHILTTHTHINGSSMIIFVYFTIHLTQSSTPRDLFSDSSHSLCCFFFVYPPSQRGNYFGTKTPLYLTSNEVSSNFFS